VIESLLIFLEKVIIPLGAGGVFLASVAEEIIAPIPSSLVMMTAGFLFISGPASMASILKLIFYVAVPAGVGVAVGSLLIYGIAYWGGKVFLDKWGKWIGLNWGDVEKMRLKFENSKRDELAVVGARIIPFVPSVAISAFCGFIRMRLWKYLALTFIGMFLRALAMGAIGWQVGNVYYKYAETISRFEKLGLLLIMAGFIIFIAILFSRRKIRYIEDNGQ